MKDYPGLYYRKMPFCDNINSNIIEADNKIGIDRHRDWLIIV
jgi:hypothetical protein